MSSAERIAWRNSPRAKSFYKSAAWRKARQVVVDRCFGLCEDCLERGEVRPLDVVHHTTPLNEENVDDPEVSLNPERLRGLCDDCHTETHRAMGIGALNGQTRLNKPRVRFDAQGNVIRL